MRLPESGSILGAEGDGMGILPPVDPVEPPVFVPPGVAEPPPPPVAGGQLVGVVFVVPAGIPVYTAVR